MLRFALAVTLAGFTVFDASSRTSVATQAAVPQVGARLLADEKVSRAIDHIRNNEPAVLDEQVRLCEIAAPPFKEGRRAEALRMAFQKAGLRNVRIDTVGNVLGERPGRAAAPHLVLSAHLDTVFSEEVSVRVSKTGPLLKGAGISDDCRGLAVLLAVIRGLDAAGIQTTGPITFVGTVGEEGLGDLRGVKHLFSDELKNAVDQFVSIDGAGLGITHVGVGSRRYRVTVKGPGGHSYGDFGLANPIHALGRIVAGVAQFEVPAQPKTTFNVGRIGGGTSVNSIASEAWMEMDLRSSDHAALSALDDNFQKAVAAGVAGENARWRNGRLEVSTVLVGNRPAGRTDRDSAIVQAAVSVTRALGLPVSLDEGSTDANIPMSLRIPAITIDGGGSASGTHSPEEVFDSTDSWRGTARAFLLALALAR